MAREIKKKVANAILYTDGCIRIDNVRLSYPHLDKPWAKKPEDKEKYSGTFLLPKATHMAAKDLIKAEMDRLLAENKIKGLAGEHKFLKNGDDSGKDENEGMFVAKASENADKPPALRNRKGELMTEKMAAQVFQPGILCNVLLRPWFQNNTHGKKINANLVGVQFVQDDGVRFGEGSIQDEEDAWDPLEDDDGDMSLDDDDDDL